MLTEEPLPEGVRGWLARHRKLHERLVVLTLALSGVSAFAGIAAAAGPADYYDLGVWAVAGSMIVLTASKVLAWPLQAFRTLRRRASENPRIDKLRQQTRLRASSILLQLLSLIAALALVASLSARVALLHITLPATVAPRLALLFTLVLVLNHAACLYYALRREEPRKLQASGMENVYFLLAVSGATAFALLGAAMVATPLDIAGVTQFDQTDAPFFLLAGATLASMTMYLTRKIPTLYTLFVGPEEASSSLYLSKTKSVMMPAMMAFALLFLVVFVILVFGVGVVGLVEEIPRSVVLLGVFGFIIAAMAVSIAASVLLSRSEDRAVLFRRVRSAEQKRTITILAISAALTSVFLVIAALLSNDYGVFGLPSGRWLDFLSFALLSALGPYGFYIVNRQKRIRRLEERFPDFLRDIAASRRAGLTLTAAVTIAARGEYGALTPEIQKMADQLSWNVPFDEALQRFADRVNTPLVQRAVSLIIEASRSGGNVTDVLLAAARDAREIKNLEMERTTTISLYAAIIYITFFVFLAVAAVLYGTFVPEILKSSTIAAKGGGFGGLSFGSVSLEDYRVFYFLAALVQGLGNGFVAGIMATGKTLSGLPHSFAMVAVTYGVFTFLLPG
jgi:flagellar protein FlaJ